MKDFFATHAPVEFAGKTTRELAALAHKAEDTGDDILLLQVADEIGRREVRFPTMDITGIFRTHYIDLHRKPRG